MILTVLKIIGIVLLVLLCVVLLLLGVVLFSPIRYSFLGEYEHSLNGVARVFWLPALFKVTVSCEENQVSYVVRLLGGVVATNTDEKISWLGRKLFSKDRDDNDGEFMDTAVEDEPEQVTAPVKGVDSNTPDTEAMPGEHDQAEVVKTKEAKPKEDALKKETSKEETSKEEASKKKTHEENKKGRSQDRQYSFFEGLGHRFNRIRNGIESKIKQLKKLLNKKDSLLRVYHSKRFDVAIKDVKKYMKGLWQIIKPKKIKGWIHFGMDDPATTGEIAGILACMLPLYDDKISVVPDFEAACLEGRLEGKGKIILFSVLILFLKIIWNKNLIKVTKKVQTIIEA